MKKLKNGSEHKGRDSPSDGLCPHFLHTETRLSGLGLYLVLGEVLCSLSSCRNLGTSKGDLAATSLTIDTISSSGVSSDGTVTFTAPSGQAFLTVSLSPGASFKASAICEGKSILGLLGLATCSSDTCSDPFKSNAFRTLGTSQIGISSGEASTFAGVALPSGYRDVPNRTDDEGLYNSDIDSDSTTKSLADVGCSSGCSTTSVVSILKSVHDTAMVSCGTGATIEAKIADCLSQNPSNATWSASTNGNSGQSDWKLVFRSAPTGSDPTTAYHEVWRDERTQLLWSSRHTTAVSNWCAAAGNNDTLDDPGCFSNTVSFCAETLTAGFAGENYSTSTYSAAKGSMGLDSTPAVRWRLPTLYDYKQAEVDGIRFVMPDMGAMSLRTKQAFAEEWTATVSSLLRDRAFVFEASSGSILTHARTLTTVFVRCVGN